MSEQGQTASIAIRVTTVVTVVCVALIAAIVSYSHMVDLAMIVGERWRSYLIPLSVDGLVVAASMVLLTRHRNGLPTSWLAWATLVAGVLASLSANIADARPEAKAILVAGWAPLAFALAFHLLLQQRKAQMVATDLDHTHEPGQPVPNLATASGQSVAIWPTAATSPETPSKASHGHGDDSRINGHFPSHEPTWNAEITDQNTASLAQAADRGQAAPEPVAKPLTAPLATAGHDEEVGQDVGQTRGHEVDSGQPVARPRPHDPAVARLLASELGHDAVANELNVSARTIRRWRSSVKDGHPVSA